MDLFLKKQLNDELAVLLANEASLERQMSTIKNLVFVIRTIFLAKLIRFRPAIQIVTQDAHNLSNTISFTAALADNISGKVRELDVTKVSLSNGRFLRKGYFHHSGSCRRLLTTCQ